MIGINRIDHINMCVHDLAESIEFYDKIFGFKLKEDKRTEREPWVVIGLPGVAYLCIYEHAGKAIPDEGLTINHFGFVVDDFEGVIGELQKNGVKVLYGGPIEWTRSRSVYIKDPSGHELELCEKVGGGLN